MKDFDSLAEFAAHLVTLQATELVALNRGLERVAKGIERVAKSEIGHYQPEVGPFPEWEELADSTEADKARKGYPLDSPLLREGDLRDSIKHEVYGLEAVVGSESKIAAYQEFGTETIPPRPFIGPAAFRNKHKIEEILGAAAVIGLTDGTFIHPALGYDFDV